MNLFTKLNGLTDIENTFMVTKGGGINQEFGINKYTLLYIKQINNKDLLYSTGSYTQHLVIIYKGKVSKNTGIYTYICVYN